eukprot:TRINITY_DN2063_c0_g1_i1.p1 TRINITY_DN2063_c0_g1~~TRINITY_DN2063_c0_g1_i1.p1  ORF type:complete len:329 (-),score=105.66 TRINITY_DN2063_c0_g1_i1:158-1144(-)
MSTLKRLGSIGAVSGCLIIIILLFAIDQYSENHSLRAELLSCSSNARIAASPSEESSPADDGPASLVPRRLHAQPRVCVAALSCRRYDLLHATLAAVIRHLERDEPELSYELVVFDQGQRVNETYDSGDEFRREFVTRYQIDKYLGSREQLGVAVGLNTLWHGLCRAPYILSIEDDWLWYNDTTAPLIADAIDVLGSGRDAWIGVYLRLPTADVFADTDVIRNTTAGIPYRMLYQGGRLMWLVAYGGALMARANIMRVGTIREDRHASHNQDGEVDYKQRVLDNNLTMALLLDDVKFVKPAEVRNGLRFGFMHAGDGRRVPRPHELPA